MAKKNVFQWTSIRWRVLPDNRAKQLYAEYAQSDAGDGERIALGDLIEYLAPVIMEQSVLHREFDLFVTDGRPWTDKNMDDVWAEMIDGCIEIGCCPKAEDHRA